MVSAIEPRESRKQMSTQATITVKTADPTTTRASKPRELQVEVLAENVNLFLNQLDGILQKAPAEVGQFQFTEFTVSAEISAQGKLVLLGTGVEAAAGAGLTFKFERRV
jgi:hypothetical protein